MFETFVEILLMKFVVVVVYVEIKRENDISVLSLLTPL